MNAAVSIGRRAASFQQKTPKSAFAAGRGMTGRDNFLIFAARAKGTHPETNGREGMSA
jgi:hypothetical protein